MRIDPAKRICLQCQKPFLSESIANRRCPKCSRTNPGIKEIQYHGGRVIKKGKNRND